MLVRNPGFTAVAVLALALGIGANTAIFSVVNAVLLEPLPYQKPGEIMRLSTAWANQDDKGILTISYPDFLDYQSQNEVFTGIAIIDGMSMTLAGGDEPERLQCALVSASLFPLLGVEPVVGRNFSPEEGQPAGSPVVIISHRLWQRRFASDPAIAARLEQAYPGTNKGKQVRVSRLNDLVVQQSRAMLLVLLGAVGLALLIACANVANLLLTRAVERQKEIAIRTAVGASQGRIVRQLLTESMMLALTGGAAGLLLALWSADAFIALEPEGIPRLDEAGINAKATGFTLVISLVTGLLFGLVHALQVSKPNLVSYIKDSGESGSASKGNRRMRDLLVVSEVALTLVLLVSAGLLIKSFWQLQQVDSGIKADNLLTLQLSLPQKEYTEDKQSRDLYRDLLARLAATPGVRSVGAVNILPLGGFSCDSFTRDDRPGTPGQLGIYGVASYSVTQRMREIGVRMALGARRGDIVKLILGQGVVLTLAGVAIGVAAASIFTRVLASFLFKVEMTDAATFAGVSLLLMAVALLACFIPARRAMKVGPGIALRYE
jgi:ABC-type antimicrobial peptide transport system permease subunit